MSWMCYHSLCMLICIYIDLYLNLCAFIKFRYMLYYHLFFYGQVLQNLIEMGFDEKDALEALRISRNNQNDAVSVFNQSWMWCWPQAIWECFFKIMSLKQSKGELILNPWHWHLKVLGHIDTQIIVPHPWYM